MIKFFVHTVAHENYQIYQVPMYQKFKHCTARFQVNIKQSFSITLFCQNTFLLIIEASRTKMVICDVPTLRALIQKRLPFFKKGEKWELGGYETGSDNTVPEGSYGTNFFTNNLCRQKFHFLTLSQMLTQ